MGGGGRDSLWGAPRKVTSGSKGLRDWSLITGRGGLQNGRGGHVKFYPHEKGGRKKF